MNAKCIVIVQMKWHVLNTNVETHVRHQVIVDKEPSVKHLLTDRYADVQRDGEECQQNNVFNVCTNLCL